MVEGLKNNVEIGDEVYKMHYKINDEKIVDTYSIVSSDSLIYDEILSNIVKFRVEKIPEKITQIENNGDEKKQTMSSTSSYQMSVNSGRQINAYWLIGVERGMAKVSVTIQYLEFCYGGGYGPSYCYHEINGHSIRASYYIEFGSGDAEGRKMVTTPDFVSGAYGMYLASPLVSVSMTFRGTCYDIEISGSMETSIKASDTYAKYASSLPYRI